MAVPADLFEKRETYGDVTQYPSIRLSLFDSADRPAISARYIDEAWLGHRALVLSNVLTPRECERIIAFMESGGVPSETVASKCGGAAAAPATFELRPALSRTEYRNNLRIVAASVDVAELITNRIRPFLTTTPHDHDNHHDDNAAAKTIGVRSAPNVASISSSSRLPECATVGGDAGQSRPSRDDRPAETAVSASDGDSTVVTIDESNRHLCLNNGFGMEGRWRLTRLNEAFRLCKYLPLGHFGPHFDSDFVPSLDCRSLKTFMIYLNDTYDGGETNFLSPDSVMYKAPGASIYTANPADIRASLKAARGDALIFDHFILHEGAQVKRGEKYIMRSDVMYERLVDQNALSDAEKKERRAIELWTEGTKLEAAGDSMGAVECYRRADKLSPGMANRH